MVEESPKHRASAATYCHAAHLNGMPFAMCLNEVGTSLDISSPKEKEEEDEKEAGEDGQEEAGLEEEEEGGPGSREDDAG